MLIEAQGQFKTTSAELMVWAATLLTCHAAAFASTSRFQSIGEKAWLDPQLQVLSFATSQHCQV